MNNPAMNGDTRNQGLVGMNDGVPLFRDKGSRSVLPLMLRTVNLSDELSMKFRYIHLAALVPCHFWIIGEESGQFERVERKTGNLCAVMHVVVDNLLKWEKGELMEDHSKLPDDPRRWFHMRALLLYWCGDYPGQGEASGFNHAAMGLHACHWCQDKGTYSMGIQRTQYTDYYRCDLDNLILASSFVVQIV